MASEMNSGCVHLNFITDHTHFANVNVRVLKMSPSLLPSYQGKLLLLHARQWLLNGVIWSGPGIHGFTDAWVCASK